MNRRISPLKFSASLAVLLALKAGAATTVNFGTVSQISGPGGLDLAGELAYAINFTPNDPPLVVNGVTFTPDSSLPAGLTVGLNVTPWQAKPNFGSGVDNDNLEEIYQDIRWAPTASGQTLQAHIPVTAGETYKVQILVYGNSATDNRRWDIEIEGALAVDEFTSLGISSAPSPGGLPAYSAAAGLVYTHTLVAGDATLDILQGSLGGSSDGGDRNPIWQALTVEHIVPDSDDDGLPDAWELEKFGGTAGQTGTDDSDTDGLSNQFEYQLTSNPGAPDSDGDGLNDGPEYFTHRTKILTPDTDGDGLNDGGEVAAGSSPLLADTDGDGLNDNAEVTVHLTSPTDRDSDDDDYPDNIEVSFGTSPNDGNAYPLYSTFTGAFTGGDQDEGLDLDGTFIAAARFGPASLAGSWPVRSATFVPYHSVAGLTQDAVNEIGGWVNPAFPGPLTPNDTNLAQVITSIRYAGPTINISLPGLLPGRSYKLQLLFAEACCANRGFDVFAEGTRIVDEFAVATVQGGQSGTPARGAAITHGFVATDSTLDIRLDKIGVTSPGLSDPNAIISALTVEEIPAGADADGDLLPDAWENEHFGNTSSGAGDDPDNDGLTNLEELTSSTLPNDDDTDNDGLKDGAEINTLQTNPRVSDSDGDGLSDGTEVNTAGSDPNNVDTDSDTLTDGAEVNTHLSSPLSIDTDNDGFNDPTEVLNGSSPALPGITPPPSYLARVLNAGASGGLDLTGNFPYAFNVGSNGAAGRIQDADFTADSAPGIMISAPNEIPNWANPALGVTAEDDILENIFKDIRWADLLNANPAMQNVKVDLENLTPGKQYKLQLLFGEQCCPLRTFDVSVEGTLVADDFNISNTQGPTPMSSAGAAVVYSFTAADSTLNIVLDGAGVVPFTNYDPNATLSGVTLEEITIPVDLDISGVSMAPGSITLDARGTAGHIYSIDYSTDLLTWEEVWDSLVPNGSGNASWTDTDPLRTGAGVRRGYYKLRDPLTDPVP